MISIIICSTKSDISYVLKENIKETVGVPYELVVIDNSKGEYSIFEAYNIGIRRSSNPCLCFIHEDIIFRTKNWGCILCNALKCREKVGVIGVIGSSMVFQNPLGWWDGPVVGHVIESDKRNYKKGGCKEAPKELSLQEVVTLDGLFLAMNKSVFEDIEFDTQTYTGFHCYDMDICLQAFKAGYNNYVIDYVEIEHFSTGNFNTAFVQGYLSLNEKWEGLLPVACNNVSSKELEAKNKLYQMTLLDNRRFVLTYRDVLYSEYYRYFVSLYRCLKRIKHRFVK